MGLFYYLWSRTAANNATADSNVNWAEGMAPSAVNDSARAMMASAAAYRDDTAGAVLTAGTSTAYTATSYQVFDSFAHLDGQQIAITIHTTSGASPTLNLDGLGAKAITTDGTNAPPTGALVAASVYDLVYSNSLSKWIVKGVLGVLSSNSVATASIANSAVTYAKIQNVAASKLIGNPTGGSTVSSEIAIGTGLAFSGSTLNGSGIVPTIQTFTSGTSQTYTTPAGAKWLYIKVVGGGSGGGGGNQTTLSTAGGASSFSTLTAGGGAGSSHLVSGAGGTATGGNVSNMTGAPGNAGNGPGLSHNSTGGSGGNSVLGGAGAGANSNSTGTAAATNSGSGGGGGGSTNGSLDGSAGCGGASGGTVLHIITSPSATYTYTVGAAGAGASGTSINSSAGGNGGSGAAGRIEVIEYY